MDLNKKNEEILKEKFHEMFENHFDEIPYYKDMKFETEIDIKDLADRIPKKRKSSFRRLKIASVILIIFIGSSLFTIVLTNGSVEAGKDKIWDFINSINGDDHMMTDEAYSLEIADLDDYDSIKKAKDMLPNLILMDEVLDGYIFDYMTVDKFDKNDVGANAVYYKDETMLSFNQSNSQAQLNIEEPDKQIKIDNGTLFLVKDVDSEVGMNLAIYVKGYDSVEIVGMVDLEKLEQFMRKQIIPNI